VLRQTLNSLKLIEGWTLEVGRVVARHSYERRVDSQEVSRGRVSHTTFLSRSAVLLMVAAIVFLALVLVVVVFQLGLVAGMPWGALTWGGRFTGKLPGSMRVVAFISAVLLVAFGMIVSIRAGLLFPDWRPISRTLIWVVVTYCILGTLANAATPSSWERLVWLPVVLGMLISSLVVGIS
jgi:hypothetical protein